jgi:hypothetical protein
MHLDLTDDEARALLNLLIDVIEADRYPMSPRIRLLQEILGKFFAKCEPRHTPQPNPPSSTSSGGRMGRPFRSPRQLILCQPFGIGLSPEGLLGQRLRKPHYRGSHATSRGTSPTLPRRK